MHDEDVSAKELTHKDEGLTITKKYLSPRVADICDVSCSTQTNSKCKLVLLRGVSWTDDFEALYVDSCSPRQYISYPSTRPSQL